MVARNIPLWNFLFLLIALLGIFWAKTNTVRSLWINVPPVPSSLSVIMSNLGDTQLAYRTTATMLQSLGDTGGRVTPLKDYNYDDLIQWFDLAHILDPQADFVPYIAAYYFGGLEGYPDQLRYIVDYLHKVGNSPQGDKWRFLARGVYLARYKLKDTDLALAMAKDLAALAHGPRPDLPHWARQMPAFVLTGVGDKEAAYGIMVEILKSAGEDMDPVEFNHTRWYICDQILEPAEAASNPLCEGVE